MSALSIPARPQSRLRGRSAECDALDGLLEAIRAGESRALVVRGERGVGKTALLDYVAERAGDCRVLHISGRPSGRPRPYDGLRRLSASIRDGLQPLPGPQRDALVTALAARLTADRFLVGLGMLGLLAEAARERPLLCLVDDGDDLDRASARTLAFVARRLAGESVAIVFAAREPSAELTVLPQLDVKGLCDTDARALLGSVIRWRLDDRVRDRIVAETRGNPLALLALPRGVTPEELAGGFGLPVAPALLTPGEVDFVRRLAPLSPTTRRLLLIAAAEPAGESALLRRAADRLGIDFDAAAEPATAIGLAEFGARVRFHHPVARSAVYRMAGPVERRRVHRALAEAIDTHEDPDRRAWHRARGADGPDEEVACELERSAGRAQARGGLAAAAAFRELAMRLTPRPSRRAQRALAAAEAKLESGAPDTALRLLVTAEQGPLDDLQRARVALLRAQVAFGVNHEADAATLLLAAARQLEPLDAGLARDSYLDALSAAMFGGRPENDGSALELARAARDRRPAPLPARAPDLLLDGLAQLILEGHAVAAPALKRALHAFRQPDLAPQEGIRWLWLACRVAAELWEDEIRHELAVRHVELAREAGALTALPLALSSRTGVHLYAGELDDSTALVEEVRAVNEVTGTQPAPYGNVAFTGYRGGPEAAELLEASALRTAPTGGTMGLTIVHAASAFVLNGLGRFDEALAAASRADEHRLDLGVSPWVLVELIEAAAMSGRPERAEDALRRLSQMTGVSGTEWALGVEARSRALLSDGDDADRFYRDAIERLDRTRIDVFLARTQLLYGEWLQRRRRRAEAREQLRIAHERLEAMGVRDFAERAARGLRELEALPETARVVPRDRNGLTVQEAKIARLASSGLSNREIGGELFISPRTVEYHLHKVFEKLRIVSRKQLDGALGAVA